MTPFQEVLRIYVAAKEELNPAHITAVAIDGEEGGPCGDDTCWFDSYVTITYTYHDPEDGWDDQRVYSSPMSPSEFLLSLVEFTTAVAA